MSSFDLPLENPYFDRKPIISLGKQIDLSQNQLSPKENQSFSPNTTYFLRKTNDKHQIKSQKYPTNVKK